MKFCENFQYCDAVKWNEIKQGLKPQKSLTTKLSLCASQSHGINTKLAAISGVYLPSSARVAALKIVGNSLRALARVLTT